MHVNDFHLHGPRVPTGLLGVSWRSRRIAVAGLNAGSVVAEVSPGRLEHFEEPFAGQIGNLLHKTPSGHHL